MTATELTSKLGISSATLKNWEKNFTAWLDPDYKNGKIYAEIALKQFSVIKYLLHERGFTIAGALKEIERQENLHGDQSFLIEKLQGLRSFLLELRNQLD
jgi:DNA-binding transcriptional MerR regulator